MIGPDNFQYDEPNKAGLIELARGWFNDAGQLIIPKSGAPVGSPTQYQYTPPTIKANSPTDFQYGSGQVGATTTSTTVDVDGGTRLFDELKSAAQATLMTGLDGFVSQRFGGGGAVQPTQVSQPTGTIAGFPVGGVVAVGVVAAFLVWKYG